MNFSLFVSSRYFFVKKSNNFIHLISLISLIGIIIGTTALVLILSVFNGFEEVVLKMYNSFDPDLKITSVTDKYFSKHDVSKSLEHYDKERFISSFILEEKTLLKYKDKEYIAVLKGVDESYNSMMRFDSLLIQGDYLDKFQIESAAILGNGVAFHLSSVVGSIFDPIKIYVPNRESKDLLNLNTSFLKSKIIPVGVFSVQADIDNTYIITSLTYIQNLLNKYNFISSVEINLSNIDEIEYFQEQLQQRLGEGYII